MFRYDIVGERVMYSLWAGFMIRTLITKKFVSSGEAEFIFSIDEIENDSLSFKVKIRGSTNLTHTGIYSTEYLRFISHNQDTSLLLGEYNEEDKREFHNVIDELTKYLEFIKL